MPQQVGVPHAAVGAAGLLQVGQHLLDLLRDSSGRRVRRKRVLMSRIIRRSLDVEVLRLAVLQCP